jgi:hypothetical protein
VLLIEKRRVAYRETAFLSSDGRKADTGQILLASDNTFGVIGNIPRVFKISFGVITHAGIVKL